MYHSKLENIEKDIITDRKKTHTNIIKLLDIIKKDSDRYILGKIYEELLNSYIPFFSEVIKSKDIDIAEHNRTKPKAANYELYGPIAHSWEHERDLKKWNKTDEEIKRFLLHRENFKTILLILAALGLTYEEIKVAYVGEVKRKLRHGIQRNRAIPKLHDIFGELKQESDGKLSKMFPTLDGSIVEHSQDIFNKLYDETNITDSKSKQTKSANKT